MTNSKDEQQPSYSNYPELLTPPATPPHNGKKPVDGKNNLDITSLEGQLDLNGWKCGSRTKTTGKPCNRPIATAKQAKALIRLQLLVSLLRLSENPEKELRLLAKTVHCHHHKHDPDLDYRVEKWKAALPLGDNASEPNAPVGVMITKLLGEVSVRCVGTTSDNVACNDRMGGRKVQNCSKTIQKIAKPEIHSHNDELKYFLRVLAENMYCHVHQSQTPKQVKIWMLEITKFRDAEDLESLLTIDDKGNQIQDSPKAKSASTRVSNPKTVGSTLCNQSIPIPRNVRSASPAEYWPEVYDTTPFDVRSTTEFSKPEKPWVRNKVLSPLQKSDRGAGYLYAYEVEGNKGFVKIGYTTRSVKGRLDEWSFDCNRISMPIYPFSVNTRAAVPNAARVEKLCHAELKGQNIRFHCTGCLKPHIEWFKISPSEAIWVIEKWSKWMRSHPYQPSSIDSSDSWPLKPEEEQRLKDSVGSTGQLVDFPL
ncbi:T5orf172 domain-containing protein [Aspergillus californicus]